jgi:hypothetical protein
MEYRFPHTPSLAHSAPLGAEYFLCHFSSLPTKGGGWFLLYFLGHISLADEGVVARIK